LSLARGLRRRLARGDAPTDRVTLPNGGRWIEVFVHRGDRKRLDYAQRMREMLAAIVARTDVVDGGGAPIDPGSVDAWRALEYEDLEAFIKGVTELVRAKRIDDDR
jgi:hypothetical protein